jgi:hypothetical protein
VADAETWHRILNAIERLQAASGQAVIRGQELVATAALRTSWVAIPCADEAEAADLERKLT